MNGERVRCKGPNHEAALNVLFVLSKVDRALNLKMAGAQKQRVQVGFHADKMIEEALPGSLRRFVTIPHETLRQTVKRYDGIVENIALTPLREIS